MLTLQKDLDRFWNKIDKTDTCWLWTGGKSNGYGMFYFQNSTYGAHVISYQLHNSDYDNSKFVCHKCDVKNCVNPSHLFLGTNQENIQDCIAKNGLHSTKGEKHYKAKLNESDVLIIRTRIQNGDKLLDIKRSYDVSYGCLINIRNKSSWKHI